MINGEREVNIMDDFDDIIMTFDGGDFSAFTVSTDEKEEQKKARLEELLKLVDEFKDVYNQLNEYQLSGTVPPNKLVRRFKQLNSDKGVYPVASGQISAEDMVLMEFDEYEPPEELKHSPEDYKKKLEEAISALSMINPENTENVYLVVKDNLLYAVSEKYWEKYHTLDDTISEENKRLFKTLELLEVPQERESVYDISGIDFEKLKKALFQSGLVYKDCEEFKEFVMK